ncbi:TrmH family RNA methyltransferase [Candidatus Mycoplasma pogonae]
MLESLQNPKIKLLQKLQQKKYRNKYDLYIVEGEHLITELQNLNLIVEIFTTNPNKQGTLISTKILKTISQYQTPQDQIAIVKKVPFKNLGNQVVLLNNLQDPSNLGSIIRTAKALGYSDVVVEGVDIYNPKTIQASQGAIFGINCINIASTEEFLLANSNYLKLGTLLDLKAQNLAKMPKTIDKPFMVIFGNEGNGIEAKIIPLLDQKIYIPINFESLNVAAAAAIVLYHFSQGDNNEKRR